MHARTHTYGGGQTASGAQAKVLLEGKAVDAGRAELGQDVVPDHVAERGALVLPSHKGKQALTGGLRVAEQRAPVDGLADVVLAAAHMGDEGAREEADSAVMAQESEITPVQELTLLPLLARPALDRPHQTLKARVKVDPHRQNASARGLSEGGAWQSDADLLENRVEARDVLDDVEREQARARQLHQAHPLPSPLHILLPVMRAGRVRGREKDGRACVAVAVLGSASTHYVLCSVGIPVVGVVVQARDGDAYGLVHH